MSLTLIKSKQIGLSLIFSIMLMTNSHATDYYSIMNEIAQQEIDEFRTEFNDYSSIVIEASAAIVALSNIDFNPDHLGWSVGVGLATIHSGYGNGNAYAIGTQYGFEYGALNIKGSYNTSSEYIIGSGFVIGF